MWLWLKKHKKETLLVAGAVALYMGLCLYHMSAVSIWFDEAYSAWIINFDPMKLLATTAWDIHPPLYYLLLQVWSFVFGDGEVAMRLLSTLFGAGVIVVSYFIARQVAPTRYAWMVPYFVAVSPILVRYGREARMYALLTLLVFISTYLLIRATRSSGRRMWYWHGVVTGLSLLTHYLAPLYWLAQWMWLSLRAYRSGERRLRQIMMPKNWRYSLTALLITSSLWLPIMLLTAAAKQADGFWVPPFEGMMLLDTVTRTFTYEPIAQLVWWQIGCIVVLIAVLAGVWWRHRTLDKSNLYLLGVSVVSPPLLLALLSLPPLVSKYYDRYLIPSMILVAVVVAVVCVKVLAGKGRGRRVVAGSIAFLYLGLSVIGIGNVYSRGNYNEFDGTTTVKEVLSDIAASTPETPVYAINPGIGVLLAYYETRVPMQMHVTQDFVRYTAEDIRGDLRQIQEDTVGGEVWIIDHVRPSSASYYQAVWPHIPSSWQVRQEVIYDHAPDQPSYRAVRYAVR